MKTNHTDLLPHWIIVGSVFLSLGIVISVSQHYGHTLTTTLPEERRIVIRTVFYALAILAFPITNLIRHIQLRLNQTVPGNTPANSRYLGTIIVSMMFMESIGLAGFVMFLLGDDFNTLYIFTGLAVLGLVLYRPKQIEYQEIVIALLDRSRSI